MEKELYAVVGTALGVVATLLATWLNTRSQARLSQINAERDLRRDELKARGDWQLKAAEHANSLQVKMFDRALDRLEPAYTSLAAISRRFSQTGLAMQENAEVDAKAFDEFYEQQCVLLDGVKMTLGVHAPESPLSTDALSGAMNVYWGNVQQLLRLRKQQPQNRQWIMDLNVEIVKAAAEVSREASKLQAGIRALVSSHRTNLPSQAWTQ